MKPRWRTLISCMLVLKDYSTVTYATRVSLAVSSSRIVLSCNSDHCTKHRMTLLPRCLVFVIMALTTNEGVSQEMQDAISLWPCYSVFKVHQDPASPFTSKYRYISKLVTSEGEVHDPDDPDCVFTMEGPPNTRLELQLINVVIQRENYVSISAQNVGNCSMGAVRIYNFTITGALVLVNEVCNSFLEGMKLLSDTNIAVVTSTVARGHFDLQATIIPTNDTRLTDLPRGILPRRKENVIRLGHTQEELNIINRLLKPSQQPSSDELTQEEEHEEENDYYDDYGIDDDFGNSHKKINADDIKLVDSKKKFNIDQNLDHEISQFMQPPANTQFGDPQNNEFTDENNQGNQPFIHAANIPTRNTLNQFDQQNVKLNQVSNHPTRNQFTQQKDDQSNQFFNPLSNNFLQNQQTDHLNQLLTNPAGNKFTQTNTLQPITQFDNSDQLTQKLNQPQKQLIDQLITQLIGTQKAQNQVTNTGNNQLTQPIIRENQIQSLAMGTKTQQNSPMNIPENQQIFPVNGQSVQQNDLTKQIINLMTLAGINQQSNQPNKQVTLPAVLPDHPQFNQNKNIQTQNNQPNQLSNSQQNVQSKQPMNDKTDAVIHFTDDSERLHQFENFMHLIRNQVADNSKDNVENKVIGPLLNVVNNENSQSSMTKNQTSVIADVNNDTDNKTIYRENSKFSNPNKDLPDHEPSQSNSNINIIETSTKANTTKFSLGLSNITQTPSASFNDFAASSIAETNSRSRDSENKV
ncbi:interaptin-like [Periplaneta americana]|uniref:interaptin-like n=1 Tax=Periplaneta americana TaxID=6978 RepID=UPI0037E8D5EC